MTVIVSWAPVLSRGPNESFWSYYTQDKNENEEGDCTDEQRKRNEMHVETHSPGH